MSSTAKKDVTAHPWAKAMYESWSPKLKPFHFTDS